MTIALVSKNELGFADGQSRNQNLRIHLDSLGKEQHYGAILDFEVLVPLDVPEYFVYRSSLCYLDWFEVAI